MKHLIHTFLSTKSGGDTVKYEIFTKGSDLGYYKKVPEGTCQIIASKFDPSGNNFAVIDVNLNIDNLYEANKPAPNTWYSDGPDRVSLDMIISHLNKLS
ncbi:hypothetical protein [Leclercia adecarboxylata]|uniref:hypothetical protein n=1 Tax=Leclercia adecarboxylata TaxID=83655 RepID=UPI00057B1E6E|nr:hypothetical protein [Leclercia adecarboxylata]